MHTKESPEQTEELKYMLDRLILLSSWGESVKEELEEIHSTNLCIEMRNTELQDRIMLSRLSSISESSESIMMLHDEIMESNLLCYQLMEEKEEREKDLKRLTLATNSSLARLEEVQKIFDSQHQILETIQEKHAEIDMTITLLQEEWLQLQVKSVFSFRRTLLFSFIRPWFL
eukprot:TRINITY_DN7668_c0_g1_i1.p2 TRINITY_DN7668_c0_g1~~TRINITY_DN7668_c0_g1_i1.p2  ORF type:complete len:173 (+),score=32.77 TRINITY_DN7668_c0_g1_i1:112-630(+)